MCSGKRILDDESEAIKQADKESFEVAEKQEVRTMIPDGSEDVATACEWDPGRICPDDGFPTIVPNGHGGNRLYSCIACSITRAAKAIESLRNPE